MDRTPVRSSRLRQGFTTYFVKLRTPVQSSPSLTGMDQQVDLVVPRQRALKHVQVREHVRSLIEAQPPGAAAPSERELVARFGVARMTVRQALDALVAEGLLERIPGRGTFVADSRVDKVPRLTGFAEEMTRRGMAPSSRTPLARVESAGPGVARALEVGVGD